MDDANLTGAPNSNVTPLSTVKTDGPPPLKPNPFAPAIRALGEPMYPFNFSVDGHEPLMCMGATMRDFFAVNAPPVPAWFTYNPDPRNTPPARPALQDQPPEVQKAVANDKTLGSAKAWYDALDDFKSKLEKWNAGIEAEKYLTWRWHYAEQMLILRGNIPATKE